MTDDYQAIDVSTADSVTTIRLDRSEKKNALNPQMHREIRNAFDTIGRDVRVVVLTGAGDAFCSGMDIEEVFLEPRRDSPGAFRRVLDDAVEFWLTLRDARVPTVAKINGWTLGAGYLLQSLCDFAIADETAEFGLPEINFGNFPGGGVMWAIKNTMGRRKGLYYAATGETFSGAKAADIGAVTCAVPPSELDDEVESTVEELKEKNPIGLKFTRDVFQRVSNMSFRESLDYELAKREEMSYYQGEEWRNEGMGQFEAREYRPGLETYDQDEK